MALLAVIFILIRSRNLQYSDVGLSYERFTQHREFHRVITSQLSHIEVLHLLFNVSSTWSLRVAEAEAVYDYLLTSLLLILLSAGVRPSGKTDHCAFSFCCRVNLRLAGRVHGWHGAFCSANWALASSAIN